MKLHVVLFVKRNQTRAVIDNTVDRTRFPTVDKHASLSAVIKNKKIKINIVRKD